MFREAIRKELNKIVSEGTVFSVERSENPEHGDYSSNIALVLAKKMENPPASPDGTVGAGGPSKVAEDLKVRLQNKNWRAETAGPGFLNFWIQKEALLNALGKKISFKTLTKNINLEFVSANPTGPLTMANGRGGFYGDALANILEAVGHKVTREYYINDAGNQIHILYESILAAEGKMPDKEEYYKGDYIKKLKGKSAQQAAAVLLKEIKLSLQKAGIKFDVWFSEASMRKKGELKETLEFLNGKKILKEKEGALWWNERVVVKSNGEPTYFLSDLAYHRNKLVKRRFDVVVTIVGADHHAEIKQVEEKMKIFGIDQNRLKIIIMQLVRLVSQGKEVKMSKRAGEFVILDDLIKTVGLDAARWFFLERSPDTHMDFDLDLAKERSKKNPVYYVQYAHARACSILKKAKQSRNANLNLLAQPAELNLIKKILQLTEIIEDITNDYQVHRLPRYAYELAKIFTDFYEKHHVIDPENQDLTFARATLVFATQKTLKQVLGLMGIAAPEKM